MRMYDHVFAFINVGAAHYKNSWHGGGSTLTLRPVVLWHTQPAVPTPAVRSMLVRTPPVTLPAGTHSL